MQTHHTGPVYYKYNCTMRFYRPAVLGLIALGRRASTLSAQPAPATPRTTVSDTLTRYCTGCHNDKLKTGGLVINVADLNRIPATRGSLGESRRQAARPGDASRDCPTAR